MIVFRTPLFMYIKGYVGYDEYGLYNAEFTQRNFLILFSFLCVLAIWRYKYVTKIDPEAKKSLILPQKNGKIAILYDKLKYSNPGEPGILYRISPDEFQQLQSPFWYRLECYDWVLCVPVKTVKLDESFQIRFMFIRTSPGFFYSAAPEVLRKETRLIRENGMEGLRMVFSVLPAVFDVATFPFLILIQLYK